MKNSQRIGKIIAILMLLLLPWLRIYTINVSGIEKDLSVHNATISSHNIKSFFSFTSSPVNSFPRDYVIHSPISILSDEEWESYSFPGSGTVDDPYIIEGYNITANEQYAIVIANTSKYVIIQHCYLKGAYKSTIFISNISSGTIIIRHNFFEDAIYTIFIEYSYYSKIIENTCFEGTIFVSYSNGTFISENTCKKGGILIDDSYDVIVSSNYCSNFSWIMGGISVKRSSEVLIEKNNVSSNEYGGIYCKDVTDLIVRENFCWNNSYGGGICFSNVTNSSILDNICINNNQENISIWGSTAVTIANNTCANTQRFYCWYGDILGWGIVVIDNSAGITIEQNECVNNTYGIALLHCNGTIIVRNNFVWNCYKAGIELYNLNNSIITYNTLFRNLYGVYIEYDAYYHIGRYVERICYNNIIHHNNFIENNLNGSSQAYDAGINNTWYDPFTLEGNYWSNAINTSIPYTIDGPAGSFDPYPLPSPVIYIPPSSYSLFHYWWFDLTLLLSSFLLLFSLFIVFRSFKLFQH